ncbi:MAG: type II toxin-antitoxin system ParD family antitoxin [Clostridia bacterium]|nr:type II toxin-antitoxin system ParD family antitoxin [Clostridia bacterium]
MHKNKSISIDDYFEDFIQSRISAGRYKNADEVVRAGLRLLEEEENKVIALKAAIQEGIESGIVLDFNYESHLKNLKAKRDFNGQV